MFRSLRSFLRLCVWLLIFATLGCSPSYDTGKQDASLSETNTFGTLYTDVAALSCLPQETPREEASVVEVIDGDTIAVEIHNRRYRVRYIGIDTPEVTTPIEYFGQEATERNRVLVENRKVTLVKDVSETDRYGRLLRYVLVDDVFVNYELVRGGFARAYTYPPDVACSDTFREAERQARHERLGLWEVTPAP